MAKKKQKIRVFFRDGRKDVIPQRFWDNYEVVAKASGQWLFIMKKGQWIAGYNLADVTAWSVG